MLSSVLVAARKRQLAPLPHGHRARCLRPSRSRILYTCGTGHLDKHPRSRITIILLGQLAQVDRALASGAKGRRFESCIAHHQFQGDTAYMLFPLFYLR